jgi:predicted small lipoprotein YifL
MDKNSSGEKQISIDNSRVFKYTNNISREIIIFRPEGKYYMKSLSVAAFICYFLVLTLHVAGCGQTGDLYIPKQSNQHNMVSKNNTKNTNLR